MSAYLVTREGQELGSFEISQIQDGLKTGFFQASDWGWRDGMDNWQGLSEIVGTATAPQTKAMAAPSSAPIRKPAVVQPGGINPYAAPAANTQSAAIGAVPTAIIAELTGTKKWVRLISVVMWIGFGFVMLHAISLFIFGAVGLSSVLKSDHQGLGVGLLIGAAVVYGLLVMLIIYPAIKLTKYASNIARLAESRSFTDLAAALAEQRRFWKFHGIILAIYLIIVALVILLALAGVGMSSMSRKATAAAHSPAGTLELQSLPFPQATNIPASGHGHCSEPGTYERLFDHPRRSGTGHLQNRQDRKRSADRLFSGVGSGLA